MTEAQYQRYLEARDRLSVADRETIRAVEAIARAAVAGHHDCTVCGRNADPPRCWWCEGAVP